MGYYGVCGCYQDIKAELRVSDGSIFTTLELVKTGERIQVTFNPMQAKLLGEMLAVTARNIRIGDISALINGDMQVSVEYDNKEDKKNGRDNEGYITDNNGGNSSNSGQGQKVVRIPAA